jgi:hypothetical protein
MSVERERGLGAKADVYGTGSSSEDDETSVDASSSPSSSELSDEELEAGTPKAAPRWRGLREL